MRFLSLFSGIEAASVAWIPLGWECAAVAEIEKFPSAVLKHHYPDVPNLGDITKITENQITTLGHIDLVVFGFPCQDLSVAGKRAGLHHQETGERTRSGLFFDAMRIVRWSGARWAVAENVPGLFSSEQGRDFALVAGEMVGLELDVPRDGWRNAGVVAGPDGLCEWTVLDAQFFGVPQRRRRVFLVRDTGDWASREPVLFERHSLSGHPAPRREKGKGLTRGIAVGPGGGEFTETSCTLDSRAKDGAIRNQLGMLECEWPADVAPTLNTHYGDKMGLEDQHIRGGQVSSSTGEIAHCPNAGGMGRQDFETETLLAVGGFPSSDVTHSLRGEGFDASEDGMGRGTPLVPISMPEIGMTLTSGGTGARGHQDFVNIDLIAFSSKDHGADAGEISPTLRSMGHDGSHANGGGQVAVAFESRFARNGRGAPSDIVPPLKAQSGETGKGDAAPLVANGMAVRRLLPVECSRLQGFPDDYLSSVRINGKPPADGPMYKALGNSMAVPCMSYIGRRIQMVEDLVHP